MAFTHWHPQVKHGGLERVEGLGKQEKTTAKESPAQQPTLAQEQKPLALHPFLFALLFSNRESVPDMEIL